MKTKGINDNFREMKSSSVPNLNKKYSSISQGN